MKIISTCDAIRDLISDYKSNNESIALVPTMGHLHAGHISLIELAKTKASRVVISIFINPIQFNQSNDFERYPRTLDEDCEKLTELNIDAVFIPEQNEIYPHGASTTTKVSVPELANLLEGEYRPGHFSGVCTVVCKLFNIITPDVAIFGNKDYQQLLIIRRIVTDLNFNIEIVSGDTQRESNGLAMSSRNSLLSNQQRELAANIHSTLKKTKHEFSLNNTESLEKSASTALNQYGFRVDYFTIRDAKNLQPVTQDTENIVILTAAWLDETRLIDNLLFPMP